MKHIADLEHEIQTKSVRLRLFEEKMNLLEDYSDKNIIIIFALQAAGDPARICWGQNLFYC
jgi:hypothetical protein